MELFKRNVNRTHAVALMVFALVAAGAVLFSAGGENTQNPGKISFGQAIGKQAPDFELQDLDGDMARLSGYRGRAVILFFNEGAMCYPGCWNQIAALSRDERLNSDEVVSFSIVADKKSTWDEITQKAPQMKGAKILFDTKKAVSASYDVLSLESSMHPGYYPGHTYFVIDKDGRIVYTLDDPNMGIWNDKLAEIIAKL
ncbi:MAG: redoxin domain-containing protein [Candidatus Aenigmarchaeota archaeon]|nr:redoxin domain-containing protein [Candidatus Aenigmarchaeota archaeon]